MTKNESGQTLFAATVCVLILISLLGGFHHAVMFVMGGLK